MSDFRTMVDRICDPLPGAHWADPMEGQIASWKIGGKMFACYGDDRPGVSVKTADTETARNLIDMGIAEKAAYFHRSWVRLPESIALDEARYRIYASYDLIRAKLPAAVRTALPPREGR